MKAFFCEVCRNRLYFENSECLSCGAPQGFLPRSQEMIAFAHDDRTARCANARLAGCNWLLERGASGELCLSCALTRTRPNDQDPAGVAEFAVTEAAKRRLLYGLMRLGLPVDHRISFDLLSSTKQAVITGHADGLVTIDLAESDDTEREKRRASMGEPYRTLLGHFRHEIGHYYQDVIVVDDWDACRSLFGDERSDYQAAMDHHYKHGAPGDWQDHHVSAYATMHPWEDWAETFAHYLHIQDTLETAEAFGLSACPMNDSIEGLMGTWLPLSYALNQVNRSMGNDDLYPFVLAPPVITKLGYIHGRVQIAGRTRVTNGP
jgi:hypothetical protein